ncbi:hypothetical protein [Sphingomonas sp. MS122]|uniref:hypothetical protein n=1 Tax=Sphingomonas sp. MS122 TaxID=3412683 RepID=UPI003C2D1442
MMREARTSLREHRDRLMSTGLAWVRQARRFQAGINIVCVMGGAALAGVGGAMEGGLAPASGDGLITVKGLCVWLGIGLVFVGGILLLLLRDEAPELLARAAALEREAQKFLDERDSLLAGLDSAAALDRKRLALIDANRTMREALEQALLVPEATPGVASHLMLQTALRFITASIGFDADEEWAISVFQVQGEGDEAVLNRIAAARADRLSEQNNPRSWKRNEAFVGAAWHSARDLIIEDSSDPQVTQDYPVPRDKQRDYDTGRYRSMAAIPVRLGAEPRIWGVVAASSNHVGRFRRDPNNRQVQTVDTVRAMARMIALMAAAFERSKG